MIYTCPMPDVRCSMSFGDLGASNNENNKELFL